MIHSHRLNRLASRLLVGSIALLLSHGVASAGTPDIDALKAQGAQALLEALDVRHNHYPTQKWVFQMTVTPRSGAARVMKFSVWQKGVRRLVRFLEPGEVKGMAVLSKGGDNMWVYSSETGGKARLVASSARRQALLGSDITYDDMATIDLSTDYDAALGTETAEHLFLDLTAKPDHDVPWRSIRIRVSRATVMIDQLEYLEGGTVIKIQRRSDFVTLDNVPVYRTIEMETVATGHKTTLSILSQKIGEDIPNSVFTKRTLVRGN